MQIAHSNSSSWSTPCCIGRTTESIGSPPWVHLLAEQERRIRTATRRELLRSAAVNGSRVDVAFLIHAHAMHPPERAGEIAPHTPGIEELAVEAVLQQLRRSAVSGPQIP